MRRTRRLVTVLTLGAMLSCTGTTGGDLLTFPAYVGGPVDSSPTEALVFDNGRGFSIALSLAVLHVGGVYLNRSVPVSGSQATSCILPALYVAQVTGGADVDVISPSLLKLPGSGEGTQTRARAGEVWLTSGDVNAADDPTPVVRVQGVATRDGATYPFRGTLTIGKNRTVPVKDASQPGASPICKQRIVSPIPIDLTPSAGGALVVRVDPRAWFANVDFSQLDADADGFFTFADVSQEQPNVSLFQGVRASTGVYAIDWQRAAPTGVGGAGPVEHVGGASGAGGSGTGGSAGAAGALPCPIPPTDTYAPATLKAFATPTDPGPKGVLFDASGEVLASRGYAFPPQTPDDPVFVDGWSVQFARVLVTVGSITLSENPDKDPGDPSNTDAPVAAVAGPWAIDLHQKGPLMGKAGTDESAIAIAALGGAGLDSSKRYAFGFDTVAATADAQNVNLDQDGLADYAEMIAKGYSVFYVGVATFAGTSCTPASPVFDTLPKVVKLRLGFRSPTTYVNCQNPDNDPAKPFANEEHERGVAIKDNASVLAQVTIHTDHPFWDSVVHDSPAHFDAIAAQYTCLPAGTIPTARVEDLVGVDFEGFRDRTGKKLPWRSCVGAAFVPPDEGTMHFDPRNVAVDPGNTDGSKLRDYADYVTYNQSTQGHLNSDGLCFVKRGYPSPQ